MYQPSIILWTIYLGLIGLGLFLRRSRVYDVSVVIFMGLLAFLNTNAADLHSVYMPVYANPDLYTSTMDLGWLLLCRIGIVLGLTYNGFACILALAATALVVLFARKTTPNESFFLSMFLVYPGLMSLVQFRQFVASAVGLIAILCLSRKNRRGWTGFAVLVLVAYSIHRSALILFAVALFPFFRSLGRKGKMFGCVIAIVLLVFVTLNAQSLGNYFFGEYRTSVYLGETAVNNNRASLLGGLRNATYTLGMCLLTPYCYHRILEDERYEKQRELLGLAVFSNIMMIALLPFLFVTNDFMRFERYGFTFGLAIFSYMPYIKRRHVVFSTKAVLLLISFLFCYSFIIKGSFNVVIGALLSFEGIPSFFV